MDRLPPIPTPASQRWREFRIRFLPSLVLLSTFVTLGLLWRERVAPPTLLGEAEAVTAQVVSPDSGILTNVWVTRFQEVKRGDVVAEVAATSSSSLESFIDTLRGRAALSQIELDPLLDQQRAAIDYHRLRLDFLRQRVELATARVNLRRAENELHRDQQLFAQQLISEDQYDLTQKTAEALQVEVAEKERLVAELDQTLEQLRQLAQASSGETNVVVAGRLDEFEADRRQFAAMVQEPVVLRAPIDGVVTALHRHAGENILAGDPILTIRAVEPERIVGYLRQPVHQEPRPGMLVRVRKRSGQREESWAQVLAVGQQFEAIHTNLLRPGMTFEVGLPIAVGLPSNLRIRPGELLDLTLRYD